MWSQFGRKLLTEQRCESLQGMTKCSDTTLDCDSITQPESHMLHEVWGSFYIWLDLNCAVLILINLYSSHGAFDAWSRSKECFQLVSIPLHPFPSCGLHISIQQENDISPCANWEQTAKHDVGLLATAPKACSKHQRQILPAHFHGSLEESYLPAAMHKCSFSYLPVHLPPFFSQSNTVTLFSDTFKT